MRYIENALLYEVYLYISFKGLRLHLRIYFYFIFPKQAMRYFHFIKYEKRFITNDVFRPNVIEPNLYIFCTVEFHPNQYFG